ncbi:hypothetical protein MYX84_14020 [Acidobacteria bacterium AH-259-O06]|nr:hypothetical protein [Acidobacteria bacterium AH-259-O06]
MYTESQVSALDPNFRAEKSNLLQVGKGDGPDGCNVGKAVRRRKGPDGKGHVEDRASSGWTLEKLGEGGMGESSWLTSLDRKVALKFVPDFLQEDPRAQKRFLCEAKSAVALDHPFICKIYETGEE